VFEQIAAAIGLAVCLVLLARLTLGGRRRQRFDTAIRRMGYSMRAFARRIARGPSERRKAAAATEDAIRRARGASDRDGNVIRPKAFRRPRKPH
jgi:hypothetical protein